MPERRPAFLWKNLLALGMVLLSRVPFFAPFPTSFDALNYMRALEHMDVRLHQPQPPGYPLYIIAGRVLLWWLHEPHRALLWLSALGSALAGLGIYALGKRLYSPRTGWLAALFLVTAPAVWYQSEVAAPYTLDLMASIGVGLLAWHTWHAEGPTAPWLLAIALGASGAFRPQTMVFLAPLAAYALAKRGMRMLLLGGALSALVFCLGFAPIVLASGGWEGYRAALGHLTEIPAWGMTRSAGFSRLVRNASIVLRLTVHAMSEPLWLLCLVGAAASLKIPLRSHLRTFFLLWLLPAWAVYVLLWPGNRGTILVSMTPFYLLAAWGTENILRRRSTLGMGIAAAVILWQAVLFAFLPQEPFGPAWQRYDNARTIHWKAAYYQNRLHLAASLPPQGTLVYAVEFRHMQVYLPQYHTFSPPIFDPQGSGQVVSIIEIRDGEQYVHRMPNLDTLIPPDTRRILLFDLPAEVIHAPPDWIQSLPVPDAAPMTLLTLPPGAQAIWQTDGIWSNMP
ncbi:MAG: DUF2723 domain-containing protein [Anaerolineae bacterium]|nr:MAG: DUF2723 domain-containing protein [Anaerolineae bacterium]